MIVGTPGHIYFVARQLYIVRIILSVNIIHFNRVLLYFVSIQAN